MRTKYWVPRLQQGKEGLLSLPLPPRSRKRIDDGKNDDDDDNNGDKDNGVTEATTETNAATETAKDDRANTDSDSDNDMETDTSSSSSSKEEEEEDNATKATRTDPPATSHGGGTATKSNTTSLTVAIFFPNSAVLHANHRSDFLKNIHEDDAPEGKDTSHRSVNNQSIQQRTPVEVPWASKQSINQIVIVIVN